MQQELQKLANIYPKDLILIKDMKFTIKLGTFIK